MFRRDWLKSKKQKEVGTMKRLVILGAGDYGRTVDDVAEQSGYYTIALDDADSDHPLSFFQFYINFSTSFIPAFGNNAFRLSWCDRIA